jgi:hypothetical protein
MGFWNKVFARTTGHYQIRTTYQIGDRVRFKNDGPITAKPAQTGYSEPVILEQKGREGTIVRFHSEGVPIVKWDAGTYRVYRDMQSTPEGIKVWDKGTVELDAFENGIHPDWIEVSVAPRETRDRDQVGSARRNGYTHRSSNDGDPSMFTCERCRKTGSHRRVTDQYAGDLWVCASCGYKTMRPKGL